MNYYNEFDPKAAAWLRQLIEDKQIPYGHVDTRSIVDVVPSDLEGYTQCHFFAGIGGWARALQLAGWPEDRPVWTASLPCQPFSTAGKQRGTEDERHLAPVYLELVRQCRPPVCFGEQVASKLARDDWFPGIRLEFEALEYAVGAADLCSPCAGEIGEGRIVRGNQESWERIIIGHPHIRQRLYWVAQSSDHGTGSISGSVAGCERKSMDAGAASLRQAHGEDVPSGADPRSAGGIDGLANTISLGYGEHERDAGAIFRAGSRDEIKESESWWTSSQARDHSATRGLSYAERGRSEKQRATDYFPSGGQRINGSASGSSGHSDECGATDGLSHTMCGRREMAMQSAWNSCETSGIREADVLRNGGAPQLLPCRDGKTRRTESGIFPLVDGLPRGVVPSGDPGDPSYANATPEARAVRLKGYGNAIDPVLAALLIKSYMEAIA